MMGLVEEVQRLRKEVATRHLAEAEQKGRALRDLTNMAGGRLEGLSEDGHRIAAAAVKLEECTGSRAKKLRKGLEAHGLGLGVLADQTEAD